MISKLKYLNNKKLIRRIVKNPYLLINVVGSYFANYFKVIYNPFLPISADIEPAAVCNFKCKMCQVTYWNRKPQSITLEDFKKVLDQIPTLMKVKIQGMGEPFLNRELIEIIQYANKKNLIISTTTNASLLTESKCQELINSGIDEVLVSIDGGTKETYEKIRVQGNFDILKRNVGNLVKARGNKKTPIIRFWIVGMNENINELNQIIQLTNELKVDNVTLQTSLTFWGKKELKEKLDGQQMNTELEEFQKKLLAAQEISRELNVDFRIYKDDKLSYNNKCIWPWLKTYITTDGFVVPCCLRADPDVLNFGNLKDKTFKEIWNSLGYKSIRKAIKTNQLSDYCKPCYQEHQK